MDQNKNEKIPKVMVTTVEIPPSQVQQSFPLLEGNNNHVIEMQPIMNENKNGGDTDNGNDADADADYNKNNSDNNYSTDPNNTDKPTKKSKKHKKSKKKHRHHGSDNEANHRQNQSLNKDVNDHFSQNKRISIHRPTKTSPQLQNISSSIDGQNANMFVTTLPVFANVYSSNEKKSNKIFIVKPNSGLPQVLTPTALHSNSSGFPKFMPMSARFTSTPQFVTKQYQHPISTREGKLIGDNFVQNPDNHNANAIQEEEKKTENNQTANDITNNDNNNNNVNGTNATDQKENAENMSHRWRHIASDLANQLFSTKGRIDNFKELEMLTADDE